MSRDSNEFTIVTCGDFVHRLTPLLDCMSDEHRLHIDEEGLSVITADVSNTSMVEVEVPATAFRGKSLTELTLGYDSSTFGKRFKHARKGRGDSDGDTVAIKGTDQYVTIEVNRRGEGNLKSGLHPTDPDSMRMEPTVPDTDFPWTAFNVPVKGLKEAVGRLDSLGHDHVRVGSEPVESKSEETVSEKETAHLGLYGRLKEDGELDADDMATFTKVCEAEEGTEEMYSLFATAFLIDVFDTLDEAKFETVNISFSQEWPIEIRFEESEYGINGRFIIAPRVSEEVEESSWENPSWESEQ